MKHVSVGGVSFAATTPAAAVDHAVRTATDPSRTRGIALRFSNAFCIALTSNDPEYREALSADGITYPDGKPVGWAMRSRFFGKSPDARQIRGPSFFPAVIAAGCRHQVRHFFFGGAHETLELMTSALRRAYPDVRIAGSLSPEFSNDIDELVRQLPAEVNRDTTDILWVALGTPKQDYVANRLAERTGLVVAAVGAAFDFTAGTVSEAPGWVQKAGLEWAYRLLSEPRRLWRRYLIGNLIFIRSLVRHRPAKNAQAL